MVHDYNVDTSLAGDLRVISCFSISLNVDNELDKPEIFSFSHHLKYLRRIISINTQPVHITTSSNRFFLLQEHYFQRGVKKMHPVQAFKSIDRLK
jgi:hypothetical protein